MAHDPDAAPRHATRPSANRLVASRPATNQRPAFGPPSPQSRPSEARARRIAAGTDRRSLVVGDVHGCIDELRRLLDACAFDPSAERLVFAGDLVAKGPDSRAVIALARQLNAQAVLGNHEALVLAWYHAELGLGPAPRLRPAHRRVCEALEADDWRWLDALPLIHVLQAATDPNQQTSVSRCPPPPADSAFGRPSFAGSAREDPAREAPTLENPARETRESENTAPAELGPVQAVVVHAALRAGVPLERQRSHDLLTGRSLTAQGRLSPRANVGAPWAQSWTGPPFVLFGHDARRGLQQHPQAWGLDTGCVYGGQLTAVRWPAKSLHAVPAARRYAPHGR